MGDYAASGGYYISCGADVIYADKNTITGSIGIFGMIPCIKPLLNDKLGIHVADISTNKNSAFLSITNPMTEQQAAAMQKHVEDGYKLFTGRVAKSRKLPVDSVLKIAEGRVWPGEIALDIKLVDKIGGINDAILAMAKKLKMKPDNYVTYPRLDLSALEKIIMSGGVEANVGTLPVNVVDNETTQKVVKLLKSLQNQTPAQARMEMIELH